jgi:hypothetical protein
MAAGLMLSRIHPIHRNQWRRLRRGFALGLFAVLCAGCADTPAPTEQIAVSKNAVESASSSGGTEFAAVELRAAQDKLALANQAMSQKEYEQARLLAEEAQVDAKLAETKARSEKAQKAVQETQEGLRVLQDELNRNTQNNAQ